MAFCCRNASILTRSLRNGNLQPMTLVRRFDKVIFNGFRTLPASAAAISRGRVVYSFLNNFNLWLRMRVRDFALKYRGRISCCVVSGAIVWSVCRHDALKRVQCKSKNNLTRKIDDSCDGKESNLKFDWWKLIALLWPQKWLLSAAVTVSVFVINTVTMVTYHCVV